MEKLKPSKNFRLFTYKVTFDAGTAPNIEGNICTLAICKPVIRRVAKAGDIILGFSPGPDGKIIYCMLVEGSMRWESYAEECKKEDSGFHVKIPKFKFDAGDCIWAADTKNKHEPKNSRSGHTIDDYKNDIEAGKNVLFSRQYWYFGTDGNYELTMPIGLKEIIPNRGHQSNKNERYKKAFVAFFNNKLKELNALNYGNYGEPNSKLIKSILDESNCKSSCKPIF